MVVWYASFVSPLQPTTNKTSITQQKYLCPKHKDAREFHTSVHLKVGGLEHIEEVEPRNQWRQCMWSQNPSWTCSPREPSSFRKDDAHNSGLQAAGPPLAIGNQEAVEVPATLACPLPSAVRHANSISPGMVGTPVTPVLSLPSPYSNQAWNPGDNRHSGGGTCHLGAQGDDIRDIGSSKTPTVTETQAVTMGAPGDTSNRGSGG